MASWLQFISFTMGVKIGVILTLLLILEIENRVYAQMSEHLNLQQQNLPTEACDSMTVSYSGASRGKREFKLVAHIFITIVHLLVLGGGTIILQSFKKLLEVTNGGKFRSLMARMSCLVTIAVMENDAEMSQLIDIVNEIRVSKKYLIIFTDTLDTTLLLKRTINLNVIINQRHKGVYDAYLQY